MIFSYILKIFCDVTLKNIFEIILYIFRISLCVTSPLVICEYFHFKKTFLQQYALKTFNIGYHYKFVANNIFGVQLSPKFV